MRVSEGLQERLMGREGRILTRSLNPGQRVYGERLHHHGDAEWREWSLQRSKPAAYLALGGDLPLRRDDRLLYLGAASGTTASHFSDILDLGTIYCVEVSPRSFRDLVTVCGRRRNMIPVMGDAGRPQDLAFAVEGATAVYQDVAQKGQASMLAENMRAFGAERGMLALKSRSEDVTAAPASILERAVAKLESEGLTVVDARMLEPYEKDHAMVVVRA